MFTVLDAVSPRMEYELCRYGPTREQKTANIEGKTWSETGGACVQPPHETLVANHRNARLIQEVHNQITK